MHGKDISIPKGHEVTVHTNNDYELKTSAEPAPPTPSSTSAAKPVEVKAAPRMVRFVSTPTGATVLIDGKYAGVTPTAELRLEEGLHPVVLKRIGFVETKFEVNGTEGAIRIDLKMDSDPTKPKIIGPHQRWLAVGLRLAPKP